MEPLDVLRAVLRDVPGIYPHLTGRARFAASAVLAGDDPDAYKAFDDFVGRVKALVKAVYTGKIAGEFVDSMAALIQRQIYLAVNNAWKDEGTEGEKLPEYLTKYADDLTLKQYEFVDQYYRDIADARIDNRPVEPLLIRAEMWARRYDEAYNETIKQIVLSNGGKLIWVYGETEHCDTCRNLNGVVAYATQWELAGVSPQNAPNPLLDCGGWRCQCRLEPTDEKRKRNAVSFIRSVVKNG